MIAYLKGKIIEEDLKWVVLDVSGVGYKIWTNTASLKKPYSNNSNPPEKDLLSEFFTYLAVRENSLDIYGFQTKKELIFFELLLTVSGIGPKSALAILSVANVSTLSKAIKNNDSSGLIKISGIGKKNAEKIVLELQGKVDAIETDNYQNDNQTDAIDALISLGYSDKQVREVLKKIKADNTEDKIKLALKELGGRN